MPSYDDLFKTKKTVDDLRDDLKQDEMDISLPKEDYNSGWMYLAKNASVTISFNFGMVPRLFSLLKNSVASEIGAYHIGTTYLNTVTGFSITYINKDQLVIKNTNSANAYFKLLLWR